MSQRRNDWNNVDGEKQVVDFRDKVKHIERNDLLFLTRLMYVDKREREFWQR